MVPLETMAAVSVVQRQMHGRGVLRPGKGIILVVLNEDMDDIIRVIKSLEPSV